MKAETKWPEHGIERRFHIFQAVYLLIYLADKVLFLTALQTTWFWSEHSTTRYRTHVALAGSDLSQGRGASAKQPRVQGPTSAGVHRPLPASAQCAPNWSPGCGLSARRAVGGEVPLSHQSSSGTREPRLTPLWRRGGAALLTNSDRNWQPSALLGGLPREPGIDSCTRAESVSAAGGLRGEAGGRVSD